MAKHAEEKKNNFLFIFLIIFLLIGIGIIIYVFYTNLNNNDTNSTNNNLEHMEITTVKSFDDISYLQSNEFDLTVENGISTINGRIFNTSNEVINDLNYLYTLKDVNNDVVYEFSINAKQIEPQDSFVFTSVVLLDLSNVVDYSIKTIQ